MTPIAGAGASWGNRCKYELLLYPFAATLQLSPGVRWPPAVSLCGRCLADCCQRGMSAFWRPSFAYLKQARILFKRPLSARYSCNVWGRVVVIRRCKSPLECQWYSWSTEANRDQCDPGFCKSPHLPPFWGTHISLLQHPLLIVPWQLLKAVFPLYSTWVVVLLYSRNYFLM